MTRDPDEAASTREGQGLSRALAPAMMRVGAMVALLAHLFAACPWWSRIAFLAGSTCFAASSVACAAACSPTIHRLQSVYGSYGVAGRTHYMNPGQTWYGPRFILRSLTHPEVSSTKRSSAGMSTRLATFCMDSSRCSASH